LIAGHRYQKKNLATPLYVHILVQFTVRDPSTVSCFDDCHYL